MMSQEHSACSGSVTILYQQLVSGDRQATDGLWKRFFPRLSALAQATVGRLPTRMSDTDDAVQSAFVSFWRQAERGDFSQDLDRDGLWSLLATLTVRKARRQLRHERTQKRGGGAVEGGHSGAQGDRDSVSLEDLAVDLNAPDFDLICEDFLSQLDDDERPIAVLRLMGYSTQEIGQQLEVTQRKVQRKLKLIQLRWEDTED